MVFPRMLLREMGLDLKSPLFPLFPGFVTHVKLVLTIRYACTVATSHCGRPDTRTPLTLYCVPIVSLLRTQGPAPMVSTIERLHCRYKLQHNIMLIL